MKILAFAAKKQVGKSSAAKFCKEILERQGKKVEEVALADPLKKMIIAGFSIPEKCCYGSNFEKDKWIAKWSLVNENIRNKYNKSKDDGMSTRELLQVLGTDTMRKHFGENIWIDLCIRKINTLKRDLVVITDCRFPNEIYGLQSHGAKIIKMYRDIELEDLHESETALDDIGDGEYDYVISEEENKDLPTLKKTIFRLLRKEGMIDSIGGMVNE